MILPVSLQNLFRQKYLANVGDCWRTFKPEQTQARTNNGTKAIEQDHLAR